MTQPNLFYAIYWPIALIAMGIYVGVFAWLFRVFAIAMGWCKFYEIECMGFREDYNKYSFLSLDKHSPANYQMLLMMQRKFQFIVEDISCCTDRDEPYYPRFVFRLMDGKARKNVPEGTNCLGGGTKMTIHDENILSMKPIRFSIWKRKFL